MAGELFKFRCFECQKLLGAPRTKAGATVKCPRCGAELIVPEPLATESETATFPDLTASNHEPPITLRTEAAGLGDLDFLRPEDVRAIPDPDRSGSFGGVTLEHDPTIDPISLGSALPTYNPLSEPLRPSPARSSSSSMSIPTPPVEMDALLQSISDPSKESSVSESRSPATQPESSVIESAVEVEVPRLSVTGMRRQDVAIPRAAVIGWAFIGILAVGFAFVAGLLSGHFLWKS